MLSKQNINAILILYYLLFFIPEAEIVKNTLVKIEFISILNGNHEVILGYIV